MINVMILKMVFRGRGRATRGTGEEIGGFYLESPLLTHSHPDLTPTQTPYREMPPASHPLFQDSVSHTPSRGITKHRQRP